MNLERIRPTIDVDRMRDSHVTLVGAAFSLVVSLVRCGLESLTLVDFGRIDASNPARQDLNTEDIGSYKVEAVTTEIHRVNSNVEVEMIVADFCSIQRDDFDEKFGHTDLFIFAADSFPVAARGSQETLRLQTPGLWIGLYQGGRAGEIVVYNPQTTPACYRCVSSARYTAFQQGGAHISSAGGTINDLHLVDAIAGHLAVGLLTQGADNRMGRLIGQLGNRSILQVKNDPVYRLGEKDLFGQYLGDHPANFCFTTIALPMEHDPQCPDCAHLHRDRND